MIHISQIENDKIKMVFHDKNRGDEISRLFDFVFFVKYLEDNYLLGLSPLGDKPEFTSYRYVWNDSLDSWTRQIDR